MGEPARPGFPRLCRARSPAAACAPATRSRSCPPGTRTPGRADRHLRRRPRRGRRGPVGDLDARRRGRLLARRPDRRADGAAAGRRRVSTATWCGWRRSRWCPRRAYWLKIGAPTVSASVDALERVRRRRHDGGAAGAALGLNDIGRVRDRPRPRRSPAAPYAESRRLGGFILIDKLTHATVAAGLVERASAGGGGRVGAPGARPGRSSGSAEAARRTRAARARTRRGAAKAAGPAGLPARRGRRWAASPATSATARTRAAEHVRRAREVALLMSRGGLDVLLALDARDGEAWPGRCSPTTRGGTRHG